MAWSWRFFCWRPAWGSTPASVTHIPIPRDTPFAQLYLDAPQIKNIAFEVYAVEE